MKWWRKQKVQPAVFELWRERDSKGISGIGHVLDGVVFPDGVTVVRWRKAKHKSTSIFETYHQFSNVHLKGVNHRGSEVRWIDGFDGLAFAEKYLNDVATQLIHKKHKMPPQEKQAWATAAEYVGIRAGQLLEAKRGLPPEVEELS